MSFYKKDQLIYELSNRDTKPTGQTKATTTKSNIS